MIYFVSNQTEMYQFDEFTSITPKESLDIIKLWKCIQFDTETLGRDQHVGKLLLMQFGNEDKSIQIVVDASTIDPLLYKEVLETKLILGQNLKFDLQWLYNYKIVPLQVYDTMIVEQLLYLGYPPYPKPGGVSYSLAAIAERYCHISIDKSIRGQIIWRGIDAEVIKYAANDVVYLYDIAKAQLQQAKKVGSTKAVKVECGFVPVIAYLEWCGIKLDVDVWKEKMRQDETKRDEMLKELNIFLVSYYREHNGKENTISKGYVVDSNKDKEWYKKIPKANPASAPYIKDKIWMQDYSVPFYHTAKNDKSAKAKISYFININLEGDLFSGFNAEPQSIINWASSDQVVSFLKILGFNTTMQDKDTGEDKESALEKHIKVQKGINDEFLDIYFKYKEADKVCTTYGQSYINAINPNTGRIHTTFKQLGCASGRMSCGNKQENQDLKKLKALELIKIKNTKLRKCGYPQLQNLPSDKLTRSAFVSEKGNLMTSCDYSALESRLGADIYNEQSMIDEYLHGSGDIHSLVAKACFPDILKDVPVADVHKLYPKLRSRAKPVEFSQQFEN